MRTRGFESLERRTLLAGVTLLTHGYQGNINGWIAEAADDIAERAGGTAQVSRYVMRVGSLAGGGIGVVSFARESGSPTRNTTGTAESVIRLDWSDLSGGSVATGEVAEVVADYLLASQGGGRPWAELPMHLIGHSRGASLVAALSQDLGQRGVWVEQVTFLDPHPVDGVDDLFGADFGDAPMRVYDNVVFADNYWRTDNNVNNFDFDGEPVAGTYDRNLATTVQSNFVSSAHAAVTAYYDGTIDTGENDGGDHPVFDSWYTGATDAPRRDQSGFAFSRLGGQKRPFAGLSNLSTGSASRTAAGASGSQWANIGDVYLLGGGAVSGSSATVFARWSDRDGRSNVNFYFDDDRNPYNAGSRWLAGTSLPEAPITKAAKLLGKVNVSPGDYYLYAKISDSNGHTRYFYDPRTIGIDSPALPLAARAAGSPARQSFASTARESAWREVSEAVEGESIGGEGQFV